jgi:hypothetical protein
VGGRSASVSPGPGNASASARAPIILPTMRPRADPGTTPSRSAALRNRVPK